jgi:hypothetical protein
MQRRFLGRFLVLLGFLGLAGLAGARFLTLYTGPWTAFVRPTREFLAAASAHDSMRLAKLGASEDLIQRTLKAAVQRPSQVGLDRLRVISGQRRGDTTSVVFAHSGCSGNILIMSFVGTGSRVRLNDVSLPCGTP